MVAQRVGGAARPHRAPPLPAKAAAPREIGYHAPAVTRDRLGLLITSSALLVSWLSAPASSVTGPAATQPAAAPARPAPPDRASELARDVSRETERLGQRVGDVPAPRRAGRDPFSFAVRAPVAPPFRPLPPPRGADVTPPAAHVAEPAVARAALRLIGIAERAGEDGVSRSAILAGASDVYIVSPGDQVIGRFTVVAVEAGAVGLRDVATDAVVRLVLPQ